ncbi:formate/nitrite transporter family protein [Veillonella intestinalis]|uniref:formate/nitrite transporter family protein n=1 Tax=Veillonella intestinalis TaxID=2941341 RepID=UPI00203B4BC8|nr:formate/nitrite transporter family protein [Veillonella intestinalis]
MKGPMLLKPIETTAAALAIGEKKSSLGSVQLLILGFLAGAFIAFASQASTMGAFNLLAQPEWYGLGRLVAGIIFGCGLVFVLLSGAELFTGNVLITNAWLCGRVSSVAMLRNWVYVYIGNFLGSFFIAWLMSQSGLWHGGANLAGAMTIKLALGKVSLDLTAAIVLGILCNWLVCLAVWLSFGTTSTSGKILSIYLPIFMFVLSGFEHCVANMYYIPAGIFAASDPSYVAQAAKLGITAEALQQLNWSTFFTKNLLPVTLGNMIGGIVFVGMAFLYGNGKPSEDTVNEVKEKVLK